MKLSPNNLLLKHNGFEADLWELKTLAKAYIEEKTRVLLELFSISSCWENISCRWSPSPLKASLSKVARLSFLPPPFFVFNSLSRDYFNVVQLNSSQLCCIHHHPLGNIRKVLTNRGLPILFCLGGFQLGALSQQSSVPTMCQPLGIW